MTVEHLDETHMIVKSDSSIREEIKEYFSFRPKNYNFHPAYKNKVWDGYIRLYSPMRPILYRGLIGYLKKFCQSRDYELRILSPEIEETVDVEESYPDWLAKEVGVPFDLRDYQKEYIINSISNQRSLSISPTGSGKSLIIYMIAQHYLQTIQGRTLVIVPSINLVKQMKGDFISYGFDANDIHTIQAGAEKKTDKTIVISTWQSLTKLDQEWFDQFRCVIGDEAHRFEAKSLVSIMEKMKNTKYKHGFTGTLENSESKTHKLVLEGIFGSIVQYKKTHELIEESVLANLKIKGILLHHNEDTRGKYKKVVKKKKNAEKYQAEREFIINIEERNQFIRKLLLSLEGQNNLVLFELVEKHGKNLQEILEIEGRNLHFIHGEISGNERERVRSIVENSEEKNHDILASYGTYSTGVNIKRLDNLIFASGLKSETKILQSIGRLLRKADDSSEVTLYDIGDAFNKYNHTLKHFKSRVQIYTQERFPFKLYNVNL